MKPVIKISQTLIDKISKINEPTYAKLYGVFFENTTILLAVQVDVKYEKSLVFSLPTEMDICGLVNICHESFNQSEITKKLHEQIDVTDNPIFLSSWKENISTYLLINDKLQSQPFVVISEREVYEHLVYVRLTGTFSVNCAATKVSYEQELSDLRNLATSGKLAFNFPRTPIYLLGTENAIENSLIGTSGEPIVGDICENSSEDDDLGRNKLKYNPSQIPHILDMIVFKKITRENSGNSEKEHAPICIVTKKQKENIHIPVKIDILSLISKQTNINRLYDILVEGIVKNLKAFELTLLNNLADESKPVLPEVYIFYPKDCGHFVSIWLPKDVDESTLVSSRRALHEQFLLPTNKPLFRKQNRYSFKMSVSEGEILINPHENIKNSKNGGKVALVKGMYAYYHYNQNNVNDSGWGCAYRSLQTLASWYEWQGYTEREVPTFEEIQKCLVDIGDKPYDFIGSRQWIGSMEVNFVLNTLLGIDCRIVNVSNGAEMAYEGPQLLRHFEEYGTPIMIGGYNLAHTILGVDYNAATDTVKFLILDPHYVGPDDLSIVQNKGWCGWKGMEFWNKTSFYNMCIPLVPTGV